MMEEGSFVIYTRDLGWWDGGMGRMGRYERNDLLGLGRRIIYIFYMLYIPCIYVVGDRCLCLCLCL